MQNWQKEKKKNNRPNYEKIADTTLEIIADRKARKRPVSIILDEVRVYLTSSLVFKATDYDKCISIPMLRMLEKYSDFTIEKSLQYIEQVLQYNQDLTYRTQVLQAFTFLEYQNDPDKFKDSALDIRKLMSKD